MKNYLSILIAICLISCNYSKTYEVKTTYKCENEALLITNKKIESSDDRNAYIKAMNSYLGVYSVQKQKCKIDFNLYKDGKKIDVILSRHTIDSLIQNTENSGFIIDKKLKDSLLEVHYY